MKKVNKAVELTYLLTKIEHLSVLWKDLANKKKEYIFAKRLKNNILYMLNCNDFICNDCRYLCLFNILFYGLINEVYLWDWKKLVPPDPV